MSAHVSTAMISPVSEKTLSEAEARESTRLWGRGQPANSLRTGSVANTTTDHRSRQSGSADVLGFPMQGYEPAPRVLQELLAEWHGYVTHVGPADNPWFSAVLTGKKGLGVVGEEEDAQIPIEDVSEFDRELVSPGNFFTLSVIREVRSDGQPRRYTQVVFRRLPAYQNRDLEAAAERARQITSMLNVV